MSQEGGLLTCACTGSHGCVNTETTYSADKNVYGESEEGVTTFLCWPCSINRAMTGGDGDRGKGKCGIVWKSEGANRRTKAK
ncbi:hypothetical protein PG995_003061 [Apiospora arundinis]